MPSINLDSVSLSFRVRERGRRSLKDCVLGKLSAAARRRRTRIDALRAVDLVAREGERIGIIGHNGAGKSTLLKLIAGIYEPTTGQRRVEGRISTLLDLGVGIEPDATGWENMRYRGYLQGQTPRQIRDKVDEIAAFSELGDFLDLPVRHYSAGMMIRLTFSIATAIEPEILLIDEVFSAGDLAFQSKAKERMLELAHSAPIVVMASHDLEGLDQLCDRILWLERGAIRAEGPAPAIIAAYREGMRDHHLAAA